MISTYGAVFLGKLALIQREFYPILLYLLHFYGFQEIYVILNFSGTIFGLV